MKTPEWVVTDVEPKTDYTLLITFTGGEQRLYNARPLLEKTIYAPLKNINCFMSAKPYCGTVVWSNDIDIAHEHLYECSQSL